MLDNLDNITMLGSESAMDFETLSSKYDALLSFYSVRTYNVLAALEQKYANRHEFLHYFVRMSRGAVRSLKNCGAKTLDEIIAIQNILNSTHEGKEDKAPEFILRSLPANIDTLLPLVLPRLGKLSVRAKNGFILFLEENHNSLAELYSAIADPHFNPFKMKNIGRNTADEIRTLLNGIKEYLESFADEQSVEDAVTRFYTKTLDDLYIPVEAQEKIRNLESALGYFPLFAAINAYLESQKDVNRVILDNLMIIHDGQSIQEKSEVSALLGLTYERVRQKRNKLIDSLTTYFATYRTLGFVDKCQYRYQMHRVHEDINASEGTDFSLPFVNWVLASVFPEITFFGDLLKTLTGYYEKNHIICIVPTDLCQYMDFEAFIQDIETRLAEKRIDEVKVSLRDLINSHLKTQYCEDEMPAIETACRSILFLHYPVDVDFGQVIFKPNARKNNALVIEDILRAAGHPMTLEEIYEEFIYQYPDRYTEMNTLRGGINNNPNIVPISRTSTYSLVEWEGDSIRGGTIRQIVVEFLREHEPTIAPLSEITTHVCQFRPTTDEYNILTNLALEKSGLFAFFFKEGERYVGLAENTYPVEYFPSAGDARNAVTMSINYPRLITFIQASGHFPFTSGVDEDEKQLCIFWRRQERYFKDGELSYSGLFYHTKILSDYGHLQMDKKEYEWRKRYATVKGCFEYGTLTIQDIEKDPDLNKWLGNALHDYRYFKDKMPQWKRGAIEDLLQLFSKSNDVQNNLG